ncbi:max-like protein x [Gigaspora margarita]|uniref:Max-like protein x n=1 Tax=Gigaspora margarita TaxID=4874 RepID=A0A8H4A1G4_GIGMA|nr:max-like protein x [Gigaspora margarita]
MQNCQTQEYLDSDRIFFIVTQTSASLNSEHESDIQFVHYNKDIYLKQGDSQILPRDEQQFDNSSVDGVDIDDKTVSHIENSLRKENMLLDKINRLNQNCLYLRAELEKEKRMSALNFLDTN